MKRNLQIGLGTLLLALAGMAVSVQAGDIGKPVTPPKYQETLFPPWQHGANNPALYKGLNFTVPEVDDLPDFHGNLDNPKLVIFVGGNYYFAMAPLVKAFEAKYPQLRGRIYSETLPPGLLLKQMQAGNTITVGNMTWTIAPDVYAAGLGRVRKVLKKGLLVAPVVPYVTNDLTIMVPKGNPAGIKSVADLGKPGIRVVMPNPKWEGIAARAMSTLRKAGGKALEQNVYVTKVQNGQTVLTHIHHRQTPLFLMQGLADAGITWKSEALFQEEIGHPISYVDIAPRNNTTAVYAIAMVRGAPHPRWARAWIKFLRSAAALKVFEHYGFKPYMGKH